MKKPPSKTSPSSKGNQLVHLRPSTSPAQTPVTAAAIEATLTKFATEMVDFEWRYHKTDAALDKVVVAGLDSFKSHSAFKFKRDDDQPVQNVTPLAEAKLKQKT